MKDSPLYGEQRKAPVVAQLHAGPVRMKFQDGELRYLYVGDKEIVRRVYFAVRDSRWDTVMPELGNVQVRSDATSFTVAFDAVCKNDIANFRWSGEMTGTPEGTITFRVTGQAGEDFQSPRVGINILYGAESLAGQPYEMIDAQGATTAGVYPREVQPGIIFDHTQGLRYTTAAGMQVTCTLTGKGFGMEDQRNYCDSSYKAYHGLDYPYPNVPKGQQRSDTLTIEVKNAVPAKETPAPNRVTLGETLLGAKVPRLLSAAQSQQTKTFADLNSALQKVTGATAVAWAFNPAAHMPDDDTFMENVSAVIDQVRTVRSVAPRATIRFDPINFDSPYPRPVHDPRNKGQFAAAWAAAMVAEMAQAGVDEAVFTLGSGLSTSVLQRLSAAAGSKVLASTISGPLPSPIRVLALPGAAWIINITAQPQTVVLGKLSGVVHLQQFTASALPAEETLAVKSGAVTFRLAPFGVCRVSAGK